MQQKYVWMLVMKHQHLVVPVHQNIPVRKSFNPKRRKAGNINTELKQCLSFDKTIMSVFKKINQIH